MDLKVRRVEKQGKRLMLYVKKPLFISFHEFANEICRYFGDGDNFLNLGIDEDGSVILTFVLRNKEDILPYLQKGSDKE